MSPLRETAPAKVNLSLRVVGKRDDGYHLLDSLVAFGAAADTLTVSPADTLTLRVDGPFAARPRHPDPDNLVIARGPCALARAAGITAEGRAACSRKALPVAAGIGGGSADAAAASASACPGFWDVDAGERTRSGTPSPLSLGADVPVCLVGPRVPHDGDRRDASGRGARRSPGPG
jgi:4-diphosphocytidyl-2-C-methyl-D-erythritol kinase